MCDKTEFIHGCFFIRTQWCFSDCHAHDECWNAFYVMSKTWKLRYLTGLCFHVPSICQSVLAAPPPTSLPTEEAARRTGIRTHRHNRECIIDAHLTMCHIMSWFACLPHIWSSSCMNNNQTRSERCSAAERAWH